MPIASFAAAACTTATPDCTEWVILGDGPSRSLIYGTYPLDVRNESITRATVVLHDTLGVPVTYVVSNPSSYAYLDPIRPTGDEAFYNYVNEKLGARHKKVIVPLCGHNACGHNARCMFTSDEAQAILFPKKQESSLANRVR